MRGPGLHPALGAAIILAVIGAFIWGAVTGRVLTAIGIIMAVRVLLLFFVG